MGGSWQLPEPVDKLYVKTVFYQFVHELMRQLRHQEIHPVKPDPVAQAIRYIHENYMEQVTLESLVDMLDLNSRQFLRMFKSRMDTSPIDYLIQVRMNKAKDLLLNSEFTLREIAEWVGYSDSYYFSRMFKKVEGLSPTGHEQNVKRMKASSVAVRTPFAIKELHGEGDEIEEVSIVRLDSEGRATERPERLAVDAVIVNHGLRGDLGRIVEWGMEMGEWNIRALSRTC
jgi:iron complex transport system substrate-binding protein